MNEGLSDGSSAIVVDDTSSDESDEDGDEEMIQHIFSLLERRTMISWKVGTFPACFPTYGWTDAV